MPFEGKHGQKYTKADARQKLVGAIARLSKNSLQSAVYVLMDALGILRSVAHSPLNSERPTPHEYLVADRLGSQDGGFRRASTNKLIGEAISHITLGYWEQAAWNIKDAAELIRRMGEAQNKAIEVRNTPEELARHQV